MSERKSWRKNGFIGIGEIKNTHLLFFPATYMLLNFLGSANVSGNVFILLHALMLSLFIGFFEETLFRGWIFQWFLEKWQNTKNHGVIWASFVSSVLFGLAHLMNMDWQNFSNVSQVASQVIYATFIGFGFCGVMLRTGSIIPLILIHAGLDAGAFVQMRVGGDPLIVGVVGFMMPIILTAPLAIYGFILMLLHEQELEKNSSTESIIKVDEQESL
jgi:membrane protease YdiL (CAAX protease family)